MGPRQLSCYLYLYLSVSIDDDAFVQHDTGLQLLKRTSAHGGAVFLDAETLCSTCAL